MNGLDKIIETNYQIRHLNVPVRFIIPILVVTLFKLSLAAILYVYLGIGSSDSYWMDASRVQPLIQNEILLNAGNDTVRWVYLYLGWDSAWYASIAAKGYSFSNQSFAFMPVLPIMTQLIQFIFDRVLSSLVIGCLVFRLIWIPIFQSIAEHYFGKSTSFFGSILFAFYPYTLLFTTVAYTEGLFLLFTLATWKLYLKKNYFLSSITLAAVALVRLPGFLIALPIVVGIIGLKEGRSLLRAFRLCFPMVLAMLSWVALMAASGDPLAILHSTEWSEMYTLPTYFIHILPTSGLEFLSFPITSINVHWFLPISIWVSIFLLPLLLWKIYVFNHSLGIYSLTYLVCIFMFGAIVSTPRFISVLFPLWFPIIGAVSKRKWLFVLLMTVFIILSGILWASFLDGVFVG